MSTASVARTGGSAQHSGWIHALFYLGLALLVGHELDAVTRHEWRLLPGLNLLDDANAQKAFVLVHVPLFAALFWLTGHCRDRLRQRSQLAVDAFLVAHAIAHFTLSGHVLYAFEGPIEIITVYGAAVIGAVHAGLLIREKARETNEA